MTTWILVKPANVKIDGQSQPLTLYKPVPENVIIFWDHTKQSEALKGLKVIISEYEFKKLTEDAKAKEDKEKADTKSEAQEAEEKTNLKPKETEKIGEK